MAPGPENRAQANSPSPDVGSSPSEPAKQTYASQHRTDYQLNNFGSPPIISPPAPVNDVARQALDALYGPRGGRLAIDGYIDPTEVARTIYSHALNHNLCAADLDKVVNLEPKIYPDKWDQFEKELQRKTHMTGDVATILYALNAEQMEYQREHYPSVKPVNLSFMIDLAAPKYIAPAPVANDLTWELHDPSNSPETNYQNFVTGALAVTDDERPAVKEKMRQDAQLVAGAFEVLQRELGPQDAQPNFESVFQAINGLETEKVRLIEERYDEKSDIKLRERLAQLRTPDNDQQIGDLLHMLNYGFDSTWVTEQLVGTSKRAGITSDDWTLDQQQKKRITWLLDRLTESQMELLARQISSPLINDIYKRFQLPSERTQALAIVDSQEAEEDGQPQSSIYPPASFLDLKHALRDSDLALLKKTLGPLNIDQKMRLIDDYNSSGDLGITLGAIHAKLGRPVGLEGKNDPILNPPDTRLNVEPKEVIPDNINQLWLGVEGLSVEREQTVRSGRPFTKQKPIKSFKGWTDDDYDALVRLAASLGPRGIPPAAFMAVFQIESEGGNPTSTNPINGAAGIFQLTNENQLILGFPNVQAMTVAEQLNEIGPAYFKQHGGRRITTPDKLYQAIFIGNPDDEGDNTVLYRYGQKKYRDNPYDHNNDRKITLGESLSSFRHELRKINSDENIMRKIAEAQNRVLGTKLALHGASSTTSTASNRN